MSDSRSQFEAATRTAVRIRDAAESDLVEHLAAEIHRDPAGFNPSRLRHLGPDGLKALVDTIEGKPSDDVAPRPKPDLPVDHSVSGWAGLRRPEPSDWRTEVLIATLLGLAVFFAGVIALPLLP